MSFAASDRHMCFPLRVRSGHVLFTLAVSTALSACAADATGPVPTAVVRLARLTEFGGISPFKQRGTYRYDAAGRFVGFDFEMIDESTDPITTRRTLYSVIRYDGDRPAEGELFVRFGDDFLKSRQWRFTYDASGRIVRRTTTWLLANDFSPIHEVASDDFAYDDFDRLVEVITPNGQRWELEYDGQGNIGREVLHTFEGNIIYFDHTYDEAKNPFLDLTKGQGGFDGIIVVVAPWALLHSRRNVVRTETRVQGVEGIISVRTVEIESYSQHGHPLRSVQELRNTGNPDGSVFAAEYEYELVTPPSSR